MGYHPSAKLDSCSCRWSATIGAPSSGGLLPSKFGCSLVTSSTSQRCSTSGSASAWLSVSSTAGRVYGAVKDFCQHQHPKAPIDRHPLPAEFAGYVGMADDEWRDRESRRRGRTGDTRSELDSNVPPRDGAGSEGVRQGTRTSSGFGGDSGGNGSPPVLLGEERIKKGKGEDPELDSAAPSGPDVSSHGFFEREIWAIRPKRAGEDPKKPAWEAFRAAVLNVDPELIARAWRAHVTQLERDKVEPRYIVQTVRWMLECRWQEYVERPAGALSTDATLPPAPADEDPRWSAARAWLHDTLGPAEFASWFAHVRLVSIERGILGVRSSYRKSRIEENYVGRLLAWWNSQDRTITRIDLQVVVDGIEVSADAHDALARSGGSTEAGLPNRGSIPLYAKSHVN